MLEELRQRLRAMERPPGLEDDPGVVPLGLSVIDDVLGGGLARGALHEVAGLSEAHSPNTAGFAAAVAGLAKPQHIVWIAEDMALAESGLLHGAGLLEFGLAPERVVSVAVPHRRDLLWAMEEALRCRSATVVIGEARGGVIDDVAARRLSLAAAESGALAFLLRTAPPRETSPAATRWIVGAAPSAMTPYGLGAPCFNTRLIRNRRGLTGSWIIEWSDSDERFILATHAQPVAAPLLDRSPRAVA